MIVLARKKLQRIVLNVPAGEARQIVVSLNNICGSQVKIGIQADPVVRVLRAELHPEFADRPLLRELRKASGEDAEAA